MILEYAIKFIGICYLILMAVFTVMLKNKEKENYYIAMTIFTLISLIAIIV